MRNYTTLPNRHLSLSCSLALHAGLLAFIMLWHASASIPQPQQVIDVSVVMISSPESQQAKVAPEPQQVAAAPETLPEPVIPVKADALQIQRKPPPHPKQAQKKTETTTKQAAATPPTSGPQSPNATQKLAAVTKPVFNAVSLHNQPPAYPADARRRGIEGAVMLEVDVTPEGAARDVAIAHSSGYAMLDKAAREAISHWRFIPAKHDGELVEAKVEVPVEFRLD